MGTLPVVERIGNEGAVLPRPFPRMHGHDDGVGVEGRGM